MMKSYELNITIKDWLGITLTGICFSTILTMLIYLLLGFSILEGLSVGFILGVILSVFSFTLVSVTNNYLIPKLKTYWMWWILASISATSAGVIGFQVAYLITYSLSLRVPAKVEGYLLETSIIIGLLNYLIGLLLFLFIKMRNSREEIFRKILELRFSSSMHMVESHFLSNLMNSIAELLHKSPESAEKALIDTARFIRMMLNDRDVITLGEELNLVEKYISLQNIRYNNKIRIFKVVKDAQLLKIKIPKFSIQILAENAITHGYTGGELLINIEVTPSKGFAKILVSNNGFPITDFKPGKGLELLKERLKIHVKGEIHLLSAQPVTFLLKIPAIS
ncbi:MAG: histidine kinase [Caldimicrobium sp.]|nr:histidine kinase [Caldimicrobium sp.]